MHEDNVFVASFVNGVTMSQDGLFLAKKALRDFAGNSDLTSVINETDVNILNENINSCIACMKVINEIVSSRLTSP